MVTSNNHARRPTEAIVIGLGICGAVLLMSVASAQETRSPALKGSPPIPYIAVGQQDLPGAAQLSADRSKAVAAEQAAKGAKQGADWSVVVIAGNKPVTVECNGIPQKPARVLKQRAKFDLSACVASKAKNDIAISEDTKGGSSTMHYEFAKNGRITNGGNGLSVVKDCAGSKAQACANAAVQSAVQDGGPSKGEEVRARPVRSEITIDR